MRSPVPVAPPDVLVETVAGVTAGEAVLSYVRTFAAIAAVELHRLRSEPLALLVRAAQPLLWLLVFGAALSRVEALREGNVPYQAFIVPGVIAQSVLFIAIFSGIAIIWERDLGITQRLVVAPVARSALILGKAAGAAVRGLAVVGVVVGVAAVAGVPVRWSPLSVAGTFAVAGLGAMLFSSISMLIASAVRSREVFMGLGQLITLPLLFASNALYPLSIVPDWLRLLAHANPLTYEVDLLRWLLVGTRSGAVLVDLAVLGGGFAVSVLAASRVYPRRVL